jgi:hypothetical protein
MQQQPSLPSSADGDATLRELDRLVAEVADLTRSDLPTHEFQQRLLERAVQATGAAGGFIWAARPNNTLHLEHQLLVSGGSSLFDETSLRRHGGLAAAVIKSGQPRRMAPGSRSAEDGEVENPFEFALVFCPLGGDTTTAVVELLLGPAVSPATQDGCQRFLVDLCELAGDFYRHRELHQLRSRDAFWRQSERFALQIHQSLDLRTTAFAIANEARLLVGCDRLSVLAGPGVRPKLLAVSGVDTVNRRSDASRRLERLAALAVAMREAISYDGTPAEWPPTVERAVQEHVDASHVRRLSVIPLAAAPSDPDREDGRLPLGVLVAESFTVTDEESWRQRLAMAATHSAAALARALEYRQLAWLPFSSLVAAVGRGLTAGRLPKAAVALLLVAAAAVVLFFVPADYDVKARGELQPDIRRDLFAPADAVVLDLLVEHGRQVEADQVVAVLRNPELDYELQRVQGELDTARRRLATVEAERVQERVEDRDRPSRYGELTAEQEELRVRLASLQQQLEILQQQQRELTVHSPIRGQVITWQVENRLRARPVVRGQRLLRVADLEGPWILELQLPEDRIQPVLAMTGAGATPTDVSFLLETEASTVYRGRLRRIAMSAERDAQQGLRVLAVVDVPREPALPLRPGAGVVAKIHCGRRSLGYVWFHDLWNKIRSQWWF